MGGAKEQMQREHDNERAMAEVLVGLGYLNKCELHEDIYIDEIAGSDADEIAKEIPASERASFGTRADVKSAIEGAIANAAMDGCPICAKNMGD